MLMCQYTVLEARPAGVAQKLDEGDEIGRNHESTYQARDCDQPELLERAQPVSSQHALGAIFDCVNHQGGDGEHEDLRHARQVAQGHEEDEQQASRTSGVSRSLVGIEHPGYPACGGNEGGVPRPQEEERGTCHPQRF